MINYQLMSSPIGQLRLVADNRGLTAIEFAGRHGSQGRRARNPVLDETQKQLAEYFAGQRRLFTITLAADGTDFQRQVWAALGDIPWGECRSYRDIAQQLGKPRAMRAVGAANGKNPIPIIVPCHRVIGSDGSLTGYAGGLEAKQLLLALEGIRSY